MFVFRVCRENETVQQFLQLQQAAEELLPRRARARPLSSSSVHLRWAVGGTQAPTDRCHQWPEDPDAWRAPGPILFVGSLLLAAVAGATRGCACSLQAHSGWAATHRILRATCALATLPHRQSDGGMSLMATRSLLRSASSSGARAAAVASFTLLPPAARASACVAPPRPWDADVFVLLGAWRNHHTSGEPTTRGYGRACSCMMVFLLLAAFGAHMHSGLLGIMWVQCVRDKPNEANSRDSTAPLFS